MARLKMTKVDGKKIASKHHQNLRRPAMSSCWEKLEETEEEEQQMIALQVA